MANRLQKYKRKIAKKKRGNKLPYVRFVDPINQETSNGCALSEMYNEAQSMPQFAILSSSGQQIGSWMKCKDYIQDCIWGGKFGKSYTCHGFEYTHGEDPLPNLKKLHLAVRYPNSEHKLEDMLENIKTTVENLEKQIKIPKKDRTRFSKVIDNYFVVYGSKHWLKATHTISFFTFLLRASFLNVGGKINTIKETPPVKKDIYYYKNGSKYIKMLKKNGIKNVEGNWDNHETHNDAHAVHNSGFVNWCGNKVCDENCDDDWDF